MTTSSPDALLKSRNFEVEALRRVADVQYDAIAVAIGCDKSTVSRMFGERGVKLAEIPLLLECLGWKVVSKDRVCIDRAIYESYKTIAAAAMTDPKKLLWDEGE